MPGFGISPFGDFSASPTPAAITSLADFNFRVKAESRGFDITATFDLPLPIEAPDWNRNLRVLRKSGEYPQSFDDAAAHISLQASYAGSPLTEDSFTDVGLAPLNDYYYCLYAQRNDGTWICDPFLNRASAYPYARWGFTDYVYTSLPRGWQRADYSQDLYKYCQILGAIFDNIKTDTEYVRSLFEIDAVHDDLLRYLDDKIAWPTWHAAGALKRRLETAKAVPLYKLIGTRAGFQSALEDVSGWNAVLYEGWRYVMFSNGLYGSVTPGPFPNPSYAQNLGLATDTLKYTNDGTNLKSWHSVNGLLLCLEEVPGISGGISAEMISRYHEIIDLVKPAYANVGLFLTTVVDEVVPAISLVDEYEDIDIDLISFPLEEDTGYSTSDVALFYSEPSGRPSISVTNSLSDRTFHSALVYV